GAICTKLPTSVCMLVRYLLTRSSSPRCWGVKAVAWSAEPPKGSVNGKKLWLELGAAGAVSPGGAGIDMGGVGASPLFGCGAGTGSGTLSAKAGAAAKAPQIAAARMTVARRDAISFSPLPRFRPPRAESELWEDRAPVQSLPARYGEFATALLAANMRRFSIRFIAAGFYQDFAFTGMIGLADDAFLLHALHERGCTVVADLQPALDIAGRGLAVAGNDLHGLLIKVGALGLARHTHRRAVEHGCAIALLGFVGGNGLEILRHALRLEMADDLFDLLVGDERPVHAADAAAASHVEHVALAEQLLRALL